MLEFLKRRMCVSRFLNLFFQRAFVTGCKQKQKHQKSNFSTGASGEKL